MISGQETRIAFYRFLITIQVNLNQILCLTSATREVCRTSQSRCARGQQRRKHPKLKASFIYTQANSLPYHLLIDCSGGQEPIYFSVYPPGCVLIIACYFYHLKTLMPLISSLPVHKVQCESNGRN